MSVPASQMWAVARYVITQRLKRRERYPLVLMLEPLFRCNLACAGCGKIQHPKPILKSQLTPEQCFAAAEECGAPIVSIPGGEPLLHPQIVEIAEGLVARKKFVYLCTNAILLKKKLDEFTPDTRLSFSVHMDGPREEHDRAVCRDGVYDKAIDGIAEAVARGFRVTTNTTVYDDADPAKMHELFDTLTEIGVEGMMVSPGYPYELAPDQDNFLRRERTVELFKEVLDRPKKGWKFNQSPLFLEFLRGNYDLECTPWGNPTYNLFGWQKPCYLLNEGHTESFADLLAQTDATKYGRASGNPKCADCMVHCGYEPTAVADTFGTWRGLLRSAVVTLFGLGPSPARVPMPSAAAGHPVPSPHLPLVSLGLSEASARETTPA